MPDDAPVTTTVRDTSVGQALVAQLAKRLAGLLEVCELHAFEDARRLRELDIPVVHDLPVVAPRVEEVVTPDHPSSRLARAADDLRLVVDDEAVVTRGHGRGGLLERDELVAEIDERHVPTPPAQVEPIDELPEELEHLVQVADLDGDVVDADEPRHASTVSARFVSGRDGSRPYDVDSAQTPASSTIVAAAAAMSCTLAHSRTEWYS